MTTQDGDEQDEMKTEATVTDDHTDEVKDAAPPLPSEPVPDGPPLPQEPLPGTEQDQDDGWDCQWDASSQAWFFYNRFTGKRQWDNPRVPDATAAAAPSAPIAGQSPRPPTNVAQDIGGYNPAIHGDYDPNAWYAQKYEAAAEDTTTAPIIPGVDPDGVYGSTATFNRFTGQFQMDESSARHHSDESKSRRQMNAFFDIDAAANADDGRSLKAERANKPISKSELKAFKEKRRARKEEKRRAWLRD